MMMMMIIIITLEKAPVVTAQNVILLTQNCFYFSCNDLSEIYLAYLLHLNKRSWKLIPEISFLVKNISKYFLLDTIFFEQ